MGPPNYCACLYSHFFIYHLGASRRLWSAFCVLQHKTENFCREDLQGWKFLPYFAA
jgi:hypothetical protein